ncbi:Keratin, type I cytoskeletal 18 [Plecturocebus cupreus]
MSFTFSTNYRSVVSVQVPSYGARLVSSTASIYAGARGSGSQISMFCSTSFWGDVGSRGLAREWPWIEESTTVVTTQFAEVEAAEMTLTELRRKVQFLEIDWDSMRNLKASLENSLGEVEARYALKMEQLTGTPLHLE